MTRRDEAARPAGATQGPGRHLTDTELDDLHRCTWCSRWVPVLSVMTSHETHCEANPNTHCT